MFPFSPSCVDIPLTHNLSVSVAQVRTHKHTHRQIPCLLEKHLWIESALYISTFVQRLDKNNNNCHDVDHVDQNINIIKDYRKQSRYYTFSAIAKIPVDTFLQVCLFAHGSTFGSLNIFLYNVFRFNISLPKSSCRNTSGNPTRIPQETSKWACPTIYHKS